MIKTAIVTGASAGIGEAIARAFAARGDNVVLASRDEIALKSAAKRCGGEALAIATDVSDPDQCKRLVEKTVEHFGGIDVVVCNAGISMWARVEEITDVSIFERIMRVNYLGTVYCAVHALEHLKKSRGLLVAISSLTGKTGVPTRSGYAASKHAVQGFCDSLRIELEGSGVGVCVISPGFVATDIRGKALGPDGTPREESPRDESRGTMSLEDCTRICMRAIDRRARDVVMTPRARLGLWLKLIAPKMVDRMASRAVRER